MPAFGRPSWSLFSEEFHCPGCAGEEAYESRPRGFLERYVLPLLFLRPVRCDHCYLRSYVPRTVAARVRPARKHPESQHPAHSSSDSRIA